MNGADLLKIVQEKLHIPTIESAQVVILMLFPQIALWLPGLYKGS